MKTINRIFLLCAISLITCTRDIKEMPFSKDVYVSTTTNFNSGSGFVNNTYSIKYTVKPKNKGSNFPVTATFVVTKDAKIISGIKEYSEKDTILFTLNKPRELKVIPTETGMYRLLMTFKDNKGVELGANELNFNIEAPEFDIDVERDLNVNLFVNNLYPVKYTVKQKNTSENIPIIATYSVNKQAKIKAGAKEYTESDTIRFSLSHPRIFTVIPAETGTYNFLMNFKDNKGNMLNTKEINFNVASPDYSINVQTDITAGGLINHSYSINYSVESNDESPLTATYAINKNGNIKVGNKQYTQQDTLMFQPNKSRKVMLTPTETGSYRFIMTFKDENGAEIGMNELNFNIEHPGFDINVVTNLNGKGLVNSSYTVKYTVAPKENVGVVPITATYSISKNAKITAGIKEYSQQDTLMFVSDKPRELTLIPTETGTYRLMMTFKDNAGTEIGKHELNFSILSSDFTIRVETNLTDDGFINNPYFLRYTVAPKDDIGDFPVTATYAISKSAKVTSGIKEYSQQDTIRFKMNKTRELTVTPTDYGTYRLMMTFKDNAGTVIGTNELNFGIETTDLNMYIVRDGNRVQNLNETENLLEYEGSFIVRVVSEKEELNHGKLTLTANIAGSSVQVKNWSDGDTKTTNAGDSPHTVDFVVEYKNINLGKTDFIFTAQSQRTSVILHDNMNVRESYPCTFVLVETPFNAEKNYYSRPQLWVGESDFVSYRIDPHPKAVSNLRRLKFEVKDPAKLSLYSGDPNQGNPQKYESSTWYDFSNKLSGKLYYMFQSTQNYTDTIYVYLQTGEMGAVTKNKLFVSCRQTDDFGFEVSFKPTLVGGYDEILFTELSGITHPVTLKVTDGNPYSKFDYKVTTNANTTQQGVIHRGNNITGTTANVPFNNWLAGTFGFLTGGTASGNTKSFNLVCSNTPADGHVGMFNWVYDITRQSDNKTKQITRKIKVIDNRTNFSIDMNTGGKESVYQNETSTAYRLMYNTPSLSSDDYQLTITSSNSNVADVYIQNKDRTFRKATLGSAEVAPATHNSGGTSLGTESGRMQIKGKQPGTAMITFTLKHKASGTEKSITKTITTVADPVQFVIEPASTIDYMSKERTAIPFGGQYHTYQHPRFKIRLQKSTLHSENTTGTAQVVFSTNRSLTNVARWSINGTEVAYDTPVNFAYDTDYYITASSSRPWNVPIGSEQFLNIRMMKATNQETPIEATFNNQIKYTLRAYNSANYQIKAEAYNEGVCGNENIEASSYPIYVYQANVIISPGDNPATRTTCDGTFEARNLVLNVGNLNDTHEFQNQPYFTGTTTGYYSKIQVVGMSITAINPSQQPSDPYWNSRGAGVRVTLYDGSMKATIRDNWGYAGEVYVTVPNKVVYGWW